MGMKRWIFPVLCPFLLMTAGCITPGCSSQGSAPPAVPTNLTAVVSTNQVGLSWAASTNAGGVAGYTVFRDGIFLQSVATPAALDSTVTGSAQYCYTVSAYDAAGHESAQSAAICMSSPATSISPQCAVIPETAVGLSGIVVRGPTQPVCSAAVSCDEPFSAGFQIEKNNIIVGAFRSTADGCFAVQVPAGNYQIVPDADAPIISPSSQTQNVTVAPDLWTQVTFTFDTGMR